MDNLDRSPVYLKSLFSILSVNLINICFLEKNQIATVFLTLSGNDEFLKHAVESDTVRDMENQLQLHKIKSVRSRCVRSRLPLSASLGISLLLPPPRASHEPQ